MRHRSTGNSKVVAILGPTGVGKTELSIKLAQSLNGEIIVVDSQAIYQNLNIGTAKPTLKEREIIFHHGIDLVPFGTPFDVASFSQIARRKIAETVERGKAPILSGGTGLYFKSVLYGLMDAPKRNDVLRQRLEDRVRQEGLGALYQILLTCDPTRAKKIHPNDQLRVIRALEIFEEAKTPPSILEERHRFKESPYFVCKVGLSRPREELYQRIHRRTEQMLEAGWLHEVQTLMRQGIDFVHSKSGVIGYSELARHLVGEISLSEAVTEIQKQTRRLAKRQLTWFRADSQVSWFHPDDFESVLKFVKSFLTN